MDYKKLLLSVVAVACIMGSPVKAGDPNPTNPYIESVKKISMTAWAECSKFFNANREECLLAAATVVGVVGLCCIIKCIVDCEKKQRRKDCLKYTENLIRLEQADPTNAEELADIMVNLIESNRKCRYSVTIPTVLVTKKVLSQPEHSVSIN